MEHVAKEYKKRTKWNRECNIALIIEMNAPEDCRIPLHLVKYGGLINFWKSVAEAMKSHHNLFPGDTFPSYKVCQDQYADLMKEHKNHHNNHQFKSGTTEDFNELSSGLDELLMNQDKVDDESAVDDEKKKTVSFFLTFFLSCFLSYLLTFFLTFFLSIFLTFFLSFLLSFFLS